MSEGSGGASPDEAALDAALDELEDELSDSEEDSDLEEEEEEEAPAVGGDGSAVVGCKHYPRGAKLVAPCCGRQFWCRLCHDAEMDEGEPDPKKQHKINRFAISECVCASCGHRQEVQQTCSACGVVMGTYFCKICKFWENRDRQQFHCDECGMCRIGGRENFRHCKRCGGCFPVTDRSHNVCIADAMKSTCPVCLEDLAVSTSHTQRMACGHMIHVKCLDQLLLSTYKCPLCSQSIVDMSSVFTALETEISLTPMPPEYANVYKHILCNDCHMECSTKFHVLGLKCIHCGSFNTREVAGESAGEGAADACDE